MDGDRPWDAAEPQADGGIRLTARTIRHLCTCIRTIEEALKGFDGTDVWERDSRQERYLRANNSRDLQLARRTLKLLQSLSSEGEDAVLYLNEANLLRMADHNLMVDVLVYDGGRLRDGTVLDLSKARSCSHQFSDIVGTWPALLEIDRPFGLGAGLAQRIK
jgi:hypothetical protein